MTVASLFKGIRAEFMTLMEAPQLKPYDPLVMMVNSQSNQEDYWIPLAAGNVRLNLDTIQLKELSDKKMSIINLEYYDGLREDRNNILDSQEYLSANVQVQLNSIVQAWQTKEVMLVDDLINNNGTAFDGTAFFSTSRNNISSALYGGSGALANTSTGAGTTTTNVYDDIGTIKSALLGFRDVAGKLFNDPNNAKWYVMAPVSMEDTMRRLFGKNQTIINVAGAAVSNPYAGLAEIVLYNTTTHNWLLVNANAPVKPFILQKRQEPEWYQDDNNKNKYVDFFYKARIGAGYGSPFCAYRVTNA